MIMPWNILGAISEKYCEWGKLKNMLFLFRQKQEQRLLIRHIMRIKMFSKFCSQRFICFHDVTFREKNILCRMNIKLICRE